MRNHPIVRRAEKLLRQIDEKQEKTGLIDAVARLDWMNTFALPLLEIAKRSS